MGEVRSLWNSDIPINEGWYWIRYRGRSGPVICPAKVSHIYEGALVQTARNDSFTETTRSHFGFADAEFGPAIPWQEGM